MPISPKAVLVPTLIFLAGASVGGAVANFGVRRSDAHSRVRFEQLIQCRNLADKHVKDSESDPDPERLVLVGYSESQNTCMAGVVKVFPHSEAWALTDILRGKATVIGACNGDGCFSGNEESAKLRSKLEDEFSKSVR